jgi:homoserine dehydrogenase
LRDKRGLIAERRGLDIHLALACDVRRSKAAQLGLSSSLFTTNPQDIIKNEKIDCVVELIGGQHPARELILQALKHKKHVVTANKALLASDTEMSFRWRRIRQAAQV